ncbi:hypothetical protein E2C01_076549 [Portunus trituberculatus]|uniref:Uncharacterized protein n=1 Tax=Portunus trituberculatus TaxID=210409 RepID=A0A5B7IBW2_PORTR|nr:hypothetical protein [Portunus trituberculatus]
MQQDEASPEVQRGRGQAFKVPTPARLCYSERTPSPRQLAARRALSAVRVKVEGVKRQGGSTGGQSCTLDVPGAAHQEEEEEEEEEIVFG